MWIIRDGQRNRGTGCYEADREGAELQLARYIELNPPPPRLPAMRAEPREQLEPSSVYVIGSRRREMPVKIGVSISPKLRVVSLQTAHHDRLIVLAHTPGVIADERALHHLFKRDRLRGEWFKRTAEIELFTELIGRRGLPIPLAIKWITDDRRSARTR